MALSKKIFVLGICMLMVSVLITRDSEAKDSSIGYGSMSRDLPYCSPSHPDRCQPQQENPWERGCEPEKDCRTGK